MRIAFVTGVFPQLSETFVLNQITGLIDRGHDVTVFANRPKSMDKVHPEYETYKLSERTHYWPESAAEGLKQGGFSLGRLAKAARAAVSSPGQLAATLAEKLEDPEFDVIYAHFGHVGDQARRLRELGVFSGKLVVVFHAYDITVFLREKGEDYYQDLFAEADLLLPISHLWRNKLIRLGADPERVKVHRMGIDGGRFEFRARTLKGETTRLVTVARLVEKKGVEYAIRAIRLALDQGMAPVRYHILGDGPLRESLESLVAKLNLDEHVVFRGWMDQDEIVRELDEAHVLLTPSVTAENGDMEGIPVVLMEGMARGLPVVSTEHSGIPELVRHEEAGLLVQERDVEGLADALKTMVDAPDTWAEYGRRGRAIVESEFEIDGLNNTLEALLNKL